MLDGAEDIEGDEFKIPSSPKMMILEVSDDDMDELDEIEILDEHVESSPSTID